MVEAGPDLVGIEGRSDGIGGLIGSRGIAHFFTIPSPAKRGRPRI